MTAKGSSATPGVKLESLGHRAKVDFSQGPAGHLEGARDGVRICLYLWTLGHLTCLEMGGGWW
jgi:hypothetical protein